LDGGLTGCNNPVLTAVTEAMVLGQAPTDIVALSLGTGTVVMPLAKPAASLRLRDGARRIEPRRRPAQARDLDPRRSADVSTFISHVMTGSGKNLQPRPRAGSCG